MLQTYDMYGSIAGLYGNFQSPPRSETPFPQPETLCSSKWVVTRKYRILFRVRLITASISPINLLYQVLSWNKGHDMSQAQSHLS